MADVTPQEMAGKLLAEGFSRGGPVAQALSDPIVETPMIVTLDELFPYELDPRITRNPLYDEIKASIRERGLDAPPSITRRPGADHYIIRNGGNTRLSILRELWSETKDERFFRIPCLFRPWPERGEIIALTGHLAENELHGGLTFIERALGVEKARELYEQESGKPLSQSELARRLSADGYPVQQSHISRMQETVRYLLPVIPTVLYNGLGRHQVERLSVLRKAAEFSWQKCASGRPLSTDFETLFHDVLAPFDAQPETFSIGRVRDELIGQMADALGADYNALDLEIDSTEHRQRAVSSPPSTPTDDVSGSVVTSPPTTPKPAPAPAPTHDGGAVAKSPVPPDASPAPSPPSPTQGQEADAPPQSDAGARLQDHIISPAATTERLQAIQQLVADQTGEPLPVFADTVLQAIPVQVGGLFPITDIWFIEPGLDSPARLRIHIAQFAQEIAEEAELTERIEPLDADIGFTCAAPEQAKTSSAFGHMVLALLRALSLHYDVEPQGDVNLGALLLGSDLRDVGAPPRLSDNGLVKFFRLVRLARRLLDLEANPDDADD
ncbi:ParB family protein [Stutzerimonas stutzeri]|uniref:ParB family protein n=1 Tax=Stutzerimonas stutzeri TaxID=316 RepID=UPI0024478BD5|nr:ParB family protein [Stutzerimonas stutzeri]MDH0425350.1 ParB family protein [Stutzerimonas stutzeri]